MRLRKSIFPPCDEATSEGIVAVGGDLSPAILLDAYSHGIFPWPHQDVEEILWFSPPQRAVLFLDEFKISRSLKQTMKKETHSIGIDEHFEAVIRACASHPNRIEGTWIRDDVIKSYVDFHRQGYAHSVEAYDSDGRLQGGLYGVSIGSMFAGESMFYYRSGYSKFCLVALVERLKQKNVTWIDVQVLNPFFESMGAREIPRQEFLKMLNAAVKSPVKLF